MPDKSNNPFQFWHELKRRKVFRVIAMYAGTAYVLIELANNVVVPLNLPDWTPRLVILLVVIGFPIIAIASWVFDITPEGIKKTESVKAAKEDETPPVPERRRFNLSDTIIVVLLVVVCILLYPKIFKKDKFEDIRNADGRISIAVMPFQNMTNDSLWDVWQGGIQNELITNLSNSTELSVRQYQTMLNILQSTEHTNYASITPSVASDISFKLQANTFIQGSIKSAGAKIRINTHLIDAETEEIYKTFQIDGKTEDDIFIITDSLSRLVRNYLEIKVLKQDADYTIRMATPTSSAEAYRYYIQGMNLFIETDYSSAIELFNKTLEIDSNFVSARIFITFAFHNQGLHEKAKLYFQRAYKQIENASYTNQLMLKYLKAYYDKDPYAVIKYLGLNIEYDPQSGLGWYEKGLNYLRIHQYEKAIQCFEKTLEIDKQWGGGLKWPFAYTLPGISYHELGNHNREKEIYELGLSVLPDHPGIIFLQAVCALSRGVKTEANDYIAKYRLIRETEGGEEYWINYSIGGIYQQAEQFDKAVDIFRDLIAKDPQEPWSKFQLGFILIDNEINVDEGMELIDQALDIAPDNVDFLYTKGLGYFKQGKVEEAYDILKEVWDLRSIYDHDHYLLLQEVEQALANQNK